MTLHRRSVAGRLLLLLALALPRPVEPAVITVGGACNLNAAIEAANTDTSKGGCTAGSGADVLELTSGVLLTEVDNDTDGPNGLPSITSRITINGHDDFIARNVWTEPLPPPFRIFHVSASGNLTLEDLLVAQGLAGTRGGGILNFGNLVLRNTTVGLNRVEPPPDGSHGYGGGIANFGRASLFDSRVSLNAVGASGVAIAHGGGIWSVQELHIENCTIRDNEAEAMDPSQRAFGGGIYADGSLTMVNSTVSGNSALATWVSTGGGIRASGLDVLIRNSTISGNTATDSEGGGKGGGVFASVSWESDIEHVTFSGNTAGVGAALNAGARVTVSGSLFANSTGDHCSGNFVDGGGGNLADDTTCKITIAGTLTDLDPTLADNGGPTKTHRLLDGSSAIDISGACGLATDQRGAGRMGNCDGGAFEHLGEGCELREFEDMTVADSSFALVCHTALVGPEFVVEGPAGDWALYAGFMVGLRNGFEVREGGELTITIDPSLLP